MKVVNKKTGKDCLRFPPVGGSGYGFARSFRYVPFPRKALIRTAKTSWTAGTVDAGKTDPLNLAVVLILLQTAVVDFTDPDKFALEIMKEISTDEKQNILKNTGMAEIRNFNDFAFAFYVFYVYSL